MEPPQNVPRVTIGSNSISTESSATMNTSTDSSSTAFTMITMTDAGDPEEVAPGAAATAVASSVIPEEDASASAVITNGSGDTATASSTEKEDEFFSAASSSTDDGSRKSSYELRSMLARNGIGPAEEYDDPVEPLLQHTTVPSENPSKIEDFKVNCFNAAGNIGDQAAAEWYQVKMKQQKSCAEGGGQRKTAQCRRRAKLLSRKYTKCFFEEERVRNDLGRNSSGFAAEQMTVDSEDSFQWESSSIASPPVPVSPTGSVSPSETGEQPLTVLSPMKTKQHFTFPPLTEANDLLNELKVKVDRNNKRNQEVAQSSTGRRESSGAAKKPKSDRRASITPSARTRSEEGRPSDDRRRHQPSSAIATIVVQQASVTGSSPEQQHQQQQQQLQHSSDDEAAVCRESCSCVLIDACCQASLANQRQHVLLVATATNSHSQSATSSDESVKSDRTIVNYNCNNNAFLLGAKKQRTPSHSEGMKHQMLDVTNTTNIGLYHWNDHDPKCSSSHHNRSQSVRTPGSKSNVQDRTSNGNCVNGGKYRPNYLCLPQQRSRVASMPNTGQEEEYYRLRQFSITGKGIINRGDSLKSRRSRSNTSVASSNSSHSTEYVTTCGTGCAVLGSTGGCNSLAGTISAAPSLPSSRESSCASCPGINPPYRVIMLGSSGVGKSSLVSQFMTSEYLQASGISIDEDFGEKSISVLLDKEESEIVFVDQPSSKILSDEYLSNYENPHGFCVVYSTTDRSSFRYAELFLQNLWKMDSIRSKAVILVGNKTDLVRSRVVTTEEGTNMATSYDSKFIETSVVINHNVDELLVGILSQIRLKQDNPPDPSIPRDQFYAKKRSRSPLANCAPRLYRGSKTSASLKVRKILSKVWSINSKSKSCENLHTL